MEYSHLCVVINNHHDCISGPEICGAAARSGGGKAARARSFRVYCQQYTALGP